MDCHIAALLAMTVEIHGSASFYIYQDSFLGQFQSDTATTRHGAQLGQ
jgi:hypothetical protein